MAGADNSGASGASPSQKHESGAGQKQWVRNKRAADTGHVVRKRAPPRLPKRPNDIYITTRSTFQSELDKCQKLLESGEKEVFVHGMGRAVNRAVNLALQLESKFPGTVQLAVNTSTTTVVDDLEPLHDQASYETQTRQNSVVHIRIHKTPLGEVQK